jgi:hypothetical protein
MPARDRLVTRTSSGYAYFRFDGSGREAGLTVGVDGYDDSGWVSTCGQWRSEDEGPSLAEFLRNTLAIPQPEAEALAETVQTKWVPEWERTGGRERSARLSRQVMWLLATIAITVLLALAGVALALLLLVG